MRDRKAMLRRGAIGAAVLAAALWLGACGAARAPIRVVTYNIHAGKDAGGVRNLDQVAALLKDTLRADVVLLQEVDSVTTRSQGEDQLATLERLTGMKGAFGRSLDFQGGGYGIAVLSRWPIDSATTVPLRVEPPQERSGTHEPRVALHAVIRAPGAPLHVVNTHVDSQGASTFRKQEIIGVMSRAARHIPADATLVLGGDLNTRPMTDEIGALSLALLDSWQACGSGGGESFPASKPDRRIDYVFLRGAGCASATVIPTLASDHRPLLVVVEPR